MATSAKGTHSHHWVSSVEDKLWEQRRNLLSGLPTISCTDLSKKPMMARRKKLIAVLRSLMLFLTFGSISGTMLGVILADVDVSERVEKFRDVPTLELCGNSTVSTPRIHGESNKWMEELKKVKRRRVLFEPKVRTEHEVPSLAYYDSEDWKFYEWRPLLLSFGLFRLRPLEFRIDLRETSCAENGIVLTKAIATRRFAEAVAQSLGDAKRRSLTVNFELMHGAILLREDSLAMWLTGDAKFGKAFEHSRGWVAFQVVLIILIAVMGADVIVVLSRLAYVEWCENTNNLIAQYDYLWRLDPVREELVESVSVDKKEEKDEEKDGLATKREPSRHSGVGERGQGGYPWKKRLQMCTPFFILDHLIGNAVTNEECFCKGLVSAMVQGFMLCLPILLPFVAAFFYTALRVPIAVVVIVHFITGFSFGVCYYFSVPYHRRWPLLYVFLATSAVLLICSVLYLTSVLVFLVAQIVVVPEEVLQILLPLGSVIGYGVIVFMKLSEFAKKVREAKKGEGKGALSDAMEKLKISTRSIVMVLIISIPTLLLIASLLLLSRAVFADENELEGSLKAWVPAVTLPIASFLKGAKEVRERRVEDLNSSGDKVSKIFDKAL